MGEIQVVGVCMLEEARAIRVTFPDVEAMHDLPICAIPPKAENGDEVAADCRTALGYLRDEMLLVRAGKATDLTVPRR